MLSKSKHVLLYPVEREKEGGRREEGRQGERDN